MKSQEVRMLKAAVAEADTKHPGYAGRIAAAAIRSDDLHFYVPRPDFESIWASYGVKFRKPLSPRIQLRKVALGDLAEKALTAVGVTKERIQRLTRRDCGCPARQRWLNRWGFQQQQRLERFLNKAAAFYFGT